MKKTKNYINFKGEYVNVENKTLTEIYNDGKLEGWIAATRKHNELVKKEDLRNEPDERPQGEWIPVSERLPEKEGFYLVFFENEQMVVAHSSGIIANHDFEPKMLAWQPLPESYKEGGAEMREGAS